MSKLYSLVLLVSLAIGSQAQGFKGGSLIEYGVGYGLPMAAMVAGSAAAINSPDSLYGIAMGVGVVNLGAHHLYQNRQMFNKIADNKQKKFENLASYIFPASTILVGVTAFVGVLIYPTMLRWTMGNMADKSDMCLAHECGQFVREQCRHIYDPSLVVAGLGMYEFMAVRNRLNKLKQKTEE